MAALPWVAAGLLVTGCIDPRSSLLRTSIQFSEVAPEDPCDAHWRPTLPEGTVAWSPVRVKVGADAFDLYPTDAAWIIDVRDSYGTPIGDREGFAVWLECGRVERQLETLECRTDAIHRIVVPPQDLPPLGDRDRRCELRMELRDGAYRWWDTNWGIALRWGMARGWLGSEHPKP